MSNHSTHIRLLSMPPSIPRYVSYSHTHNTHTPQPHICRSHDNHLMIGVPITLKILLTYSIVTDYQDNAMTKLRSGYLRLLINKAANATIASMITAT